MTGNYRVPLTEKTNPSRLIDAAVNGESIAKIDMKNSKMVPQHRRMLI